MWESPVNIYETISNMMEKEIDGNIIVEIKKQLGIDINKEELIKALQYDRNQYEKGYQDGLNADKWIYCKDRLPDDLSEVIVCLEDGFVTSTLYGFGEFAPKSTITRKFVKGSPVVAWQPLPSIPKE